MEQNKALQLLGLARKGRNLETGEGPVTGLVRAGKARLVLVARDASERTRRQIRGLAEGTAQPVTDVPFTKAELGAALGTPDTALAAVTDTALALAFLRALPDPDPELLALLEKRDKRRKERASLRKRT